MSNTLTNLLYHIVFSTKNRLDIIIPSYQEKLYEYIGGLIKLEDGILLEIGGTSDHVHIFMKNSKNLSISQLLKIIKGKSSKWVNENQLIMPNKNAKFNWQIGYSTQG